MTNDKQEAAQAILLLDPFRVKPFAEQPRKRFRGIAKLAESIRLVGQVTPILVTSCDDEDFDAELVDGERRLQACRSGKMRVKAVMQMGGLADPQRFALSIAANFCRQGHDAMEIAAAIKVLRDNGRTAEEIAGIFGKSMCWVYQHAYLLELSPVVQEMLHLAAIDEGKRQVRRSGRLTMGLALLMRPLAHAKQAAVAKHIVKRRLSFSEAKRCIAVKLSCNGHATRRRSSAPANRWQRFWKATVEYRAHAEKLAMLKHADLCKVIQEAPANQVQAMAAQLNDLIEDLRGIAKTVKQGIKQS